MSLISLAVAPALEAGPHGRLTPASMGLFLPPPEFFQMVIAFGLALGLCAVAGIRILRWAKRTRSPRRTP